MAFKLGSYDALLCTYGSCVVGERALIPPPLSELLFPGELLSELLKLCLAVLFLLDLLVVGLDLGDCLLGGNPLEAMDLALADPDALGAEEPAEALTLDPVGVCYRLGRSELLGLGGSDGYCPPI